MAQSGYTPIQLYRSATASAAPVSGNLTAGEIALNYNTADMALYAKNSGGSVIRIMNNPSGLKYPTVDGTSGQVIKTDGAGNLSWVTATTGTVTAVSVVSANGFAGSSSGGSAPALTLSTTVTGLLKGNGTAISAASSGTDYAPATSGSSILYGNGSGGFSNVTIGSGLLFSAGTLSATTSATISGSGTTNYIPKFTSSTAIGNSVIYDNGTNVGIGTSSPQSKLNVYGSAGTAVLTLSDSTLGVNYGSQLKGYGSAGLGGFGEFGVLDAGTYSKAITVAFQANYVAFNTGYSGTSSNAERMRIDSSGIVLIGTSSSYNASATRLQMSNGTLNTVPNGADVNFTLGNSLFHSVDNNGAYCGLALYSNYSPNGTQPNSGQPSWNMDLGGRIATPSDSFTISRATASSTSFNTYFTILNSGNVGIGTTSPSYKLDVVNAGGLVARIYNTASTNVALLLTQNTVGSGYFGMDSTGLIMSTSNSIPLLFTNAGFERMRIDSSGNVGIGTSSPTYKLQLSTDSAAKPSTNTWTIASDERIKNVTGEYTKGLDAVCALRPITYEYNGAAGFEADGKENISIIAQEAITHFPECVGTFNAKLNETDETETELYNWNGHALTFALVNAIKELKAELDSVKAELQSLKGN